MTDKINFITPIGRLVQGSLYEPQTTDMQNNPLIVKSGPKMGQPMVKFFFALAIAKKGETHWNQTEWGAMIWNEALKWFPNGQSQSPQFAWKIKDGDSTIPNRANKRPCDQQGFIGHWVLNFTSSFAPTIVNHDGSQYILEKNFINLGDYLQVYASVSKNTAPQQPGLFLNHKTVAFSGYGNRIILAPDPKTLGFGKSEKPAGLSDIPVTQTMTAIPVSSTTKITLPPLPMTSSAQVIPVPMTPTPSIAPYPQILNMPMPPSSGPIKKLTERAGAHTYDELIGLGWTDELLVQHGLMEPF